MNRREGAGKIALCALLAAADLSAAILVRHEDRVLRAIKIWDADRNATQYASVIDELETGKRWIAIDAFADLHEIGASRSAIYDPYRDLLKECSDYTERTEEGIKTYEKK